MVLTQATKFGRVAIDEMFEEILSERIGGVRGNIKEISDVFGADARPYRRAPPWEVQKSSHHLF